MNWMAPRGGRRLGFAISVLLHLLLLLLFLDWSRSQTRVSPMELPHAAVSYISLPPAAPQTKPQPKPAAPPKPVQRKPRPAEPPTPSLQPVPVAAPEPAPQAPSVESAPAAAPAAASSASAPSTISSGMPTVQFPMAYLIRLSRMVAAQLNYPSEGRRAHQTGTALVRIQLQRDGTVIDAKVIKGTGHESLDREARNVILRIGRLPPVPGYVMPGQQEFVIDQPVQFDLS